MKTISTIALALILFTGKAQDYSLFTIVKVTPSAVCPGQSITVAFTYTTVGVPDNNYVIQFIFKQKNGTHYSSAGYNYPLLATKPTTMINGQTCTMISIPLPTIFPIGSAEVYTQKDSITSNKMDFEVSCVTGIQEYGDMRIMPIYYNITGDVVELRTGELLIEQRGTHRRKIVVMGQ